VFLAGFLGSASALVICHEHDWLHAQVSRTTRWISEFAILAFGSALFAATTLFGAAAMGLPSGITLSAYVSACLHWAAIGLVVSSLPTPGWAHPVLLAGLGWVLPALLAGPSPVHRALAGLLDASRHLHLESHPAATRMADPVDMAPIGALALGSWLMRRRSGATR
jgi:hypothetical protein